MSSSQNRLYNALFLCTGNSARSILAEAIINKIGTEKFRGFSAGSHPAGQVHPLALELLEKLDHPTENPRPKSWDEFSAPGAPELDFIFTVCDNAAGGICPIWPGKPATAHWGMPDPAAIAESESEKRSAFAETCRIPNTAPASSPTCSSMRWTASASRRN